MSEVIKCGGALPMRGCGKGLHFQRMERGAFDAKREPRLAIRCPDCAVLFCPACAIGHRDLVRAQCVDKLEAVVHASLAPLANAARALDLLEQGSLQLTAGSREVIRQYVEALRAAHRRAVDATEGV